MKNFDDFIDKKIKELYIINRNIVKKECFNYLKDKHISKDLKFKIEKLSEKINMSFDDIVKEVVNSDIVASFLSKDPKKQNIGEITQQKYLKKRGIIVEKIKYMSILDGKIIYKKQNRAIKSVDFKRNNDMIYAKWTEGNAGGAQDNQFKDVIHFLEESEKYVKNNSKSDLRFVVLLDGLYYKNPKRLKTLNKFLSEKIIITNSDEYK